VDCDEGWENERTPIPDRVFGVRLHSMGLSVREVVAVLDLLGADRSHGAVGTGRTNLRRAKRPRRRQRRRGSPLMRTRLRSMAKRNGCTRRHFCIGEPRNTACQTLSFWLMAVAIWLPSFDTIWAVSSTTQTGTTSKMIPDCVDATRLLSFVLAGQSSQRTSLAQTV